MILVLLTVLELIIEVLKVAAGPLLGVLVGGYFLQKFFASRANEAQFIDYLEEQISELRTDAFAYWTLPEGSSGIEASQKMKADIQGLYCDVMFYVKRYSPKEEEKFMNAMVNILTACTGGGFECVNRTSDPERYMKITTAIHELKFMIFNRKL